MDSSKSSAAFWKLFCKFADPDPARDRQLSKVSTTQLYDVFQQHMNPPCPLPLEFDRLTYQLNQLMARCIPTCTTDSALEQFFNRDFDASEIERAKAHIHRHCSDSSIGNDAIHYNEIEQMDNDLLLQLVNKCIHSGNMPTSWTIMTVVGIVKRGKDRNDPNSYRTIAVC